MTARQTALIQDSFADVRELGEPLILLFYGRLFDLDPSLRSLFQNSLRMQSGKLLEMFDVVVNSLDNFEAVRPRLHALGSLHAQYGVKAADYHMMTTALLWALGQALGPSFTVESRDAWAEILHEISREMLCGAEQALHAGS